MKILVASSEVTPLAKTGGLADVAGALPFALAELGHDVAVVMPFYGTVRREGLAAELLMPRIEVALPIGSRFPAVWRAELANPHAGGPALLVFLIEDQGIFDRPQLYAQDGREYPDNGLRFGIFCLATLWMLKGLGWTPDVIQANDWQTALIPIYLRHLPVVQDDSDLMRIRVLFSIHNMSYQGIYPAHTLGQLGLPDSLMNVSGLEYYGSINLLKGALLFSDWLTTVSPQYACEIQTAEYGAGLEGVLRDRSDRLSGILNGIDVASWNPATDPALPAHYGGSKLAGKAQCKAALQVRFGLPTDPKVPLIGIISRLADQKGFDLLAEIMADVLAEGVQFVLLGTGQPEYHTYFKELAAKYPDQVGIELGFDDRLAHQIEAGADVFLMPSRFEPCGLNQMYSLRYGTVPVVRRTGGLADSIVDATPATLAKRTATGFVFDDYTGVAFMEAIRRAVKMYREHPRKWKELIHAGMNQDFSWHHSALEYERVMRSLLD